MKERCVLWSNKDSMPLCQTEKAICIKGQHAFKKPTAVNSHLARVHNNCDHSDSEDKLLYASFLWQSPKNIMQATKIDFRNKRQTNAAMQHNDWLMKTLCVEGRLGGMWTKCSARKRNVR